MLDLVDKVRVAFVLILDDVVEDLETEDEVSGVVLVHLQPVLKLVQPTAQACISLVCSSRIEYFSLLLKHRRRGRGKEKKSGS